MGVATSIYKKPNKSSYHTVNFWKNRNKDQGLILLSIRARWVHCNPLASYSLKKKVRFKKAASRIQTLVAERKSIAQSK